MDNKAALQRLALLKEWNKPEWHRPCDMGIKEFKRFVKTLPISKKTARYMVERYKLRAWSTFDSLPKLGTFPTHPMYGTKVIVEYKEIEYKVEVDGKK